MRVFLETERLILRAVTMDDIDNLAELHGDPEVMYFINGGRPTSRDEIEATVLPRFISYYQDGLRYGFWEAHATLVEAAQVELLGATRAGPHGHYATVHVIAQRAALPAQRTAADHL